MNKLKSATTGNLGFGEASYPNPALVLDGAPEFQSWPLLDGRIASGVWSATIGHHRVVRDASTLETFYILEGEITLFEDGVDQPRHFGPGDLVVLEPGFTGSWKTTSAVKKIYFTTNQ
ncbi:cupin [Ochrobactrum sp. POC9]|uniref:cupin domain-containing protein n=1 Tax=unclassified Ochrobactrum TaxID=239106 RepID=UPI000D707862|nr:cupin domain-containing protein [Ochrobactrum sp. POC9]MCH4543306.1 cupin domain-containing protein [Ochrobactrum sp. A-1]PWU70902.1 cupin [Ochrobactrum sp. POC9]